MFEKVNPSHPDKIADRIAGALVDYAYKVQKTPKIAVEVLIGHGYCHIITETSVEIPQEFVNRTVSRIAMAPGLIIDYKEYPQDAELAANQKDGIRCGDNGIFKGVPTNSLEQKLSSFARKLYEIYPTDGKFIIRCDEGTNWEYEYTICQSQGDRSLEDFCRRYTPTDADLIINPLGHWLGGVNVDTGATNRKLGSDMGRAVTGGGLHGKDLSKADVAVNIYAHCKAQKTGEIVEVSCAIGDDEVDGMPYELIVKAAKGYIDELGGFEKLAEWGMI